MRNEAWRSSVIDSAFLAKLILCFWVLGFERESKLWQRILGYKCRVLHLIFIFNNNTKNLKNDKNKTFFIKIEIRIELSFRQIRQIHAFHASLLNIVF